MENKRGFERYVVLGLDMVAEYAPIPKEADTIECDCTEGLYLSAVIHNISYGGICLTVENPDIDVGREIVLTVTVIDPEATGKTQQLSLEFVAQVVWISEDTTGYRTGMEFVEVPEDFPERFERIASILKRETITP